MAETNSQLISHTHAAYRDALEAAARENEEWAKAAEKTANSHKSLPVTEEAMRSQARTFRRAAEQIRNLPIPEHYIRGAVGHSYPSPMPPPGPVDAKGNAA